MSEQNYQRYRVWDRTVRLFHWINVLCMLGLIAVGLVIFNSKALGIPSDGKIILKTLHVYIGYVFVFNLSWRIIWGFCGSKYARWSYLLDFGPRFRRRLQDFSAGVRAGRAPAYLGHNPLGKMMVVLLYVSITMQAITGLVLAGTDVYMPPFGHEIAEWVAEEPSAAEQIRPYSKEGVNPQAYEEMRAFRKPFITIHVYNFYLLLIAVGLHVAGVVFSEVRERCGLVSAMFTGNKFLRERPVDADD